MRRPLVLLTNDDGHAAPGLVALAAALEEEADVMVVAPQRPQSAVSHSITLHKPVRLWQERPDRWVCSGSPVDCVYIGVHHVCRGRKPNLVASGVNLGANLGNDVFYSGTVAGAMEGLLLGIPALAVSQAFPQDGRHGASDYAVAARLATTVAARMVGAPLSERLLLNLNVPYPCDDVEAKGIRVARLGRRIYGDSVTESADPRGRAYYWIGGTAAGFEPIPGSDCQALSEGFATLTPLRPDLTHDALLPDLEAWCRDLSRAT